MLLSVALILLVGMGLGWLCRKVKLPGLLGMLVTGIVLGPYVLDLIDPDILNISPQLRKIALVIIQSGIGSGSVRIEENRPPGNHDVFCTGIL